MIFAGTHLFSVFFNFLPAATQVFGEVSRAMADGEVSAEEARNIGFRVSDELGDIRLIVRGRDIIAPAAQREIMGGLGRIARQLAQALQ